MTAAADDTPSPVPARQADRRRQPPEIRPGGRREYTLTLDEVAEVLKVHVKMVRKWIRAQYDEDCAAALAHRPAERHGLRALYVSTRIRRIKEAELCEFIAYLERRRP
jgi:hypothetical protein